MSTVVKISAFDVYNSTVDLKNKILQVMIMRDTKYEENFFL